MKCISADNGVQQMICRVCRTSRTLHVWASLPRESIEITINSTQPNPDHFSKRILSEPATALTHAAPIPCQPCA
jgi:hypothetical protein